MIDFDDVIKKHIKRNNPNWPQILMINTEH